MPQCRLVLILALAVGLTACNSEERQLKTKAEWLCRYALTDVKLDAFPDKAVPGDYIDAEDLEALKQKAAEEEGGALAVALVESMRPAMKALLEARAKHTKCTILKTTINGDRATVEVRGEIPTTDAPMEKLRSTLSESDHAARVAMAEKWFASGERKEQTASMEFVKTPQGWRRHFGFRKEFEVEKTAAAIDALMLDDRIREADSILKDAQARYPGSIPLEARSAILRGRLKEFVAGDWRLTENRDPMTDDRNVYVRLAALEKISTGFSEHRPTLWARCAERTLQMFVNIGTGIDSDYGELYQATGRIRFNDEPAERITFSVSDDRDAVFFRAPRKWVERLQANESKQMLIEVPTYRQGAQVVRFALGGAKPALDLVTSACAR